jgi:mono/diheme cytochrome c family protein
LLRGGGIRSSSPTPKDNLVIRAGRLLRNHPEAHSRAPLLLWLCLLLAGCAGLAGEPQIVATFPPPTTAPADVGYPPQPPDLANGARIFADRCASCHGPGGAGDGPLVRAGSVSSPASFIDPATARDQTPRDWFDTITNGRLEMLMPPWRDALSEQERWDVAYYTYTLHYDAGQLMLGQAIWEAECADCHGMTGRGDGPQAAVAGRDVNDLTDQAAGAVISDAVMYTYVAEGAGDAMPAYADTLTEAEMWASVAYARALALANREVIGQQVAIAPAATEEASPAPPAGVIVEGESAVATGRITHGTAGFSAPPDMEVTLFATDGRSSQGRYETAAAPDGSFRFEGVALNPQWFYIAVTAYQERTFTSDFAPAAAEMELPITLYEATDDPAVIYINGIVSQITAVGEGLQVVQVINFRNNSDRMFTSSQPVSDSRFASVVISLPPGAVVLGFPNDSQERYIIAEGQETTIIDTAPVLPGGDHIIQLVFFLPYQDGAVIEQGVNYAVDGPVRLLLRPQSVTARSDQLAPIGPQTVGSAIYTGYGGVLSLQAGDSILYELAGTGVATAAEVDAPVVASSNLVVVIIIVLAGQAALIGGLYLYYRRRQSRPDQTLDKNRLIDALAAQIAELEAAHDRGDINHDLYHHRRRQLKARLSELMDKME